MASGRELPAELPEVVDLPVHDHRQGAVLVEDRLVTTGDVDDRQSLHTERDATVHERPA